jgi:hypothetical protein
MLETFINERNREVELARKLKIGDKVKIKSEEELRKFFPQYNHYGLVASMLKYAGKEFYIEAIGIMTDGIYYLLKGCGGYSWSAYLFDFGIKKKKYSIE